MSRASRHLLNLLIVAALLLAPIAGAGMMHGGAAGGMTAADHCLDHGAGSPADPMSSDLSPDLVIQAAPSACEMPCAVCGACGVSGLPSPAGTPVTAAAPVFAPLPVAMGPGIPAAPDLRPPL
ncbi:MULTISPECIES: hypothetical protein [unclassified Thioalkalivibrio]|uniref:hypothetical protein n=1 Tax=unclassified Thioalkalivibrio TaxID=2621013 RepID=UPI0009DAE4A1|nr:MULTISPECIES: hypothetical protein [unclassified Thioalkalivibrio]